MIFKLVRIDSEEPRKITLPVGKNLIGRGKFINCDDKRVSRNHGELEVSADKVTIKSLHANPCFILKKGMVDTQLLKLNCITDINNGDRFGLLPDSYWYELLLSVDDTPAQQDVETQNLQVDQGNSEDTQSIKTESMDSCEGNRNDETDLNDTTNSNNSQSLLGAVDQQGIEVNTAESSVGNERQNLENDNVDDRVQVKVEPNTPTKRPHDLADNSSDIKKIKTEPDVKPDPDAQAGPSDQAGSNSNDGAQNTNQPQPNPILRERCMYGANCYRRNPQHKAQFSHPSDADWGTGAQVPCPYGAACRKPDPRHWRDHSHPPGLGPPSPNANYAPPNNAGNKRKKPKPKKKKSSDDDDSPTADLIVQGKRVRKTINRTNGWSDGESEEDPFGTDESDEWQPSSDVTDSQLYSQDL